MNVLIADDDAVSRRLLQGYLQKWGHAAAAAATGAEAWRLFEDGEFPLVISDWIMPEMDGLELIRRIRSSGRMEYIYTILLSARSDKADIVQGMEAGADDFLSKPFDPNELRVRVRAGERIIELESALLSSLRQLGEARAREVEIGGKIQQTLLLGEPPRGLRGISVAALTIPSQQIDGDFYDFFEPNGRRLDVVIGDVMGKGVPAALLAAAIKNQFLRALTLPAAARDGCIRQPQEIVAAVHHAVIAEFIGLEFFATLCYTRFDLEEGRVSFVDCGHTGTIHFQRRTGHCCALKGQNTPLGFNEREVYGQHSLPLEPGDVFFFYSDGVTEARDENGTCFGEERLLEVIGGQAALPPDALIDQVRGAVLAFSRQPWLEDDLTCVAVAIEASNALQHHTIEIPSDLRQLAHARAFVREICRRSFRNSGDWVAQLELAVTEAASNIIKHAYRGERGHAIQLHADVRLGGVAVLLRHRGEPFQPGTASPPSFDGRHESGFGVFIIDQSVDEVRYYTDPQGWNCVSLIKNCEPTGGRE